MGSRTLTTITKMRIMRSLYGGHGGSNRSHVCVTPLSGTCCGMASKRELIEPHEGDKRYIRRDEKGRIDESVDVGRSLAQDVRQHSTTVAKPGQGDKGDRKRPTKKN